MKTLHYYYEALANTRQTNIRKMYEDAKLHSQKHIKKIQFEIVKMFELTL